MVSAEAAGVGVRVFMQPEQIVPVRIVAKADAQAVEGRMPLGRAGTSEESLATPPDDSVEASYLERHDEEVGGKVKDTQNDGRQLPQRFISR